MLEQLTPYPLRAKELLSMTDPHTRAVIFLEEGIYPGGAGMIFRDLLSDPLSARGIPSRILAIRDPFLPSERGKRMVETAGIDADSVVRAVHSMLSL